MVGILVKYQKKNKDNILKSYIEGENYETVLRKFLKAKGGKEKISIQSIQDWDREKNIFTIDEPITIEDKENVVYQVMNE